MKRFVVIFLFIVLSFQSLSAGSNKEGKLVKKMGFYPIDEVGIKQARIRALMEAKRQAIEEGCGVEIRSSSLVNMGALTNDICHAIYRANVEEYNIVKDSVNYIKNPDGSLTGNYIIEAEFYIVCDEGKEDPGFNLNVQLNKHTFEEGEELEVTVTSTRDCYISVFSVYENGEIHLIFPNAIEKSNFLRAGEKKVIPGDSSIYSLELSPHEGQLQNNESVIAVATKKNIPLFGDIDRWKIENTLGPNVDSSIFVRWLLGIDRDKRAVAVDGYSVSARRKE